MTIVTRVRSDKYLKWQEWTVNRVNSDRNYKWQMLREQSLYHERQLSHDRYNVKRLADVTGIKSDRCRVKSDRCQKWFVPKVRRQADRYQLADIKSESSHLTDLIFFIKCMSRLEMSSSRCDSSQNRPLSRVFFFHQFFSQLTISIHSFQDHSHTKVIIVHLTNAKLV